MAIPITVIIPCYNESNRLGSFFSLIENELELNWEWLFVDDGSLDDTSQKVNDFRKIDPENIVLISLSKNQGKGAAVRAGFLRARGELAGYVDADLAASPLVFQQYLDDEDIKSGHAMLLGIRLKTQDGSVQRLLYRHIMGRVYQTFVSMLTGLMVYDTQCGFKLLSRKKAVEIAEKMCCAGFAFDAELILLALEMGMNIKEMQIPWQEKGDSRVRPRHLLEMMLDIWKIRKRIKVGKNTQA